MILDNLGIRLSHYLDLKTHLISMKFVQNHLTTHHLFHAPHKWFFAFLLSPIHAAELHYQNRYHLRFAHARKLFLFDMFLIACVFACAGLWAFISLYDPTVVKNIELTISASQEKIRNGDPISYTVSYKNRSNENLIDGKIVLDLPKGFVIEKTEPEQDFISQTKTFVLPHLSPGAGGQVRVSGTFFGNAEEKILLPVHFSYKQESRMRGEEKLATISLSPRGSILELNLSAPSEILDQSVTKASIQITNNGDRTLEKIGVVIQVPGTSKTISSTSNQIQGNTWIVPESLSPGKTATIDFSFQAQGLAQETIAQISATPEIMIQGNTFILAQQSVQSAKVVVPQVDFTFTLENQSTFLLPGKIVNAGLQLTNRGNVGLTKVDISIPLQDMIDGRQIAGLNHGVVQGATFHINEKYHAGLTEIAPGATVSIPVKIPLKATLSGNNIVFSGNSTLSAQLKNISGTFSKTTQTGPYKIGTRLNVNASMRYYTAEGDQLGRGPLPPQVGKETKYGAIIYITNGTSVVENMRFSAQLPPFVTWSDRASASQGKEPTFDPTTREVRWSTLEVLPGQTISVFLQLGFTPNQSQIGTTPVLVTNISVNGTDMFINQPVSATSANLDASLPNDAIARVKGVKVKE